MSTTWTLTRFVRWRVTDWASCFLACRLPLDDESDRYSPSTPQFPVRNVVFGKKKDKRIINNESNNIGDRRVSRPCKKSNKKTQLCNVGLENAKDGVSLGQRNIDVSSNWTHFVDEDYIVFCFKEDEACDVVKDSKTINVKYESPNIADEGKPKSLRPLNPKDIEEQLNCGEQRPNVQEYNTGQTNEEYIIASCTAEYENAESIYLDIHQLKEGVRRSRKIEETQEHSGVSIESRDSNQSECSTGSFVFPVPVQMPKTEGFPKRNQRVRSVLFQCCRF